jgi:predicted nucleic acid-binding Zn ribbon protein
VKKSRPKPDKKQYPTKLEFAQFNQMRERGKVTVFRASRCITCGEEIPKFYVYCSEKCYNRQKTKGVVDETSDQVDC